MFDAGKEYREKAFADGFLPNPGRRGFPCGDPAGKVTGGHGSGNAVALGIFAAELEQKNAVLDGFHAFGDRVAAEGIAHVDDPFEDDEIVGIHQHLAHEALIDLEAVGREAAQVGQRGVTGTEIVKRNPDTQGAAGIDDAGNVVQVFQGARFEDFHFKVAGKDFRMRSQVAFQLGEEIRVFEFGGTDVDADGQIDPGIAPGIHL